MMSKPIRMAFKEWAVICEALAQGKQSLILRKGGIAESAGTFTPDHARFWLYPTNFHQQADALKPDSLPLLEVSRTKQPPHDELHLQHFCEVIEVVRLVEESKLSDLDPYHLWSMETVRKRFHYREPGLYVLRVRVFALPTQIFHVVRPEYEGCKTWVDLGEEIPTDTATPVLATGGIFDYSSLSVGLPLVG
jgi:hypothetical protein